MNNDRKHNITVSKLSITPLKSGVKESTCLEVIISKCKWNGKQKLRFLNLIRSFVLVNRKITSHKWYISASNSIMYRWSNLFQVQKVHLKIIKRIMNIFLSLKTMDHCI